MEDEDDVVWWSWGLEIWRMTVSTGWCEVKPNCVSVMKLRTYLQFIHYQQLTF